MVQNRVDGNGFARSDVYDFQEYLSESRAIDGQCEPGRIAVHCRWPSVFGAAERASRGWSPEGPERSLAAVRRGRQVQIRPLVRRRATSTYDRYPKCRHNL